MLALALTALAAGATLGALLALRRRRSRAELGLTARLDPLPAGVHHLGKTVSDLSDLGLHLRVRGGPAKPRLGALLVR